MDLESELLKNTSKEEIEASIDEKIKSFHGLLTREVAIRLIAKEKGLLKEEEREYKLADIPKNQKKLAFRAEVRRIWPVASYSSGKRSRVVEIGEGSIMMPLILWNDDVELARGLRLKDEIMVKGAYESGGELHLGYSGSIEVSKRADFSSLGALPESGRVHVRGFVTAVLGTDDAPADGKGAIRRAFVFSISDGTNETKCAAWEGSDRAATLRAGDEVMLEGAEASGGMLLIDSSTRFRVRRKEMLVGEVKRLECEGDVLVADIGGKELRLEREKALRLLGAQVAPDISLSTVVELKKDAMMNKRVALRID